MKHCNTIKEAINCKNTKCDKRELLFNEMKENGLQGLQELIKKEIKQNG